MVQGTYQQGLHSSGSPFATPSSMMCTRVRLHTHVSIRSHVGRCQLFTRRLAHTGIQSISDTRAFLQHFISEVSPTFHCLERDNPSLICTGT